MKQTGSRDVVILHLSDTQFGQYHVFTNGVDSLASRLIIDLESLGSEIGSIDLLVLSGDIAEQAKAKEFRTATTFIAELCEALSIDSENLVFAPGNHDVNWNLCKAYFADSFARDLEPREPFRPKYEFYLDFLESVTGVRAEETFAVKHYSELDLSVAVLDATRRETHEHHYGHCGEEQYRSLANELQAEGLGTRIAVVHHNARRGAVADEENLHDVDDLTRILGPQIDLLLHGHTHNGQRDALSDGTLVLSTGSAAVNFDWRPSEVPNQYQILKLTADAIVRRARRYERDQNRWVADSRIGSDATPGLERIPFQRQFGGPASVGRELTEHEPVTLATAGDPLSQVAAGSRIDEVASDALRRDMRLDALPGTARNLSSMELLSRMGLARDGQLTLAGVLIVGLDPQSVLPTSLMQCVRYVGADKSSPVRDSVYLNGNVQNQVDGATEFILSRIERQESPSGLTSRSEVSFRYPIQCLREVIVNAIVHRDYMDSQRTAHLRLFDDRIEVWSPGRWMGRSLGEGLVNLSDLASESIRRNPLLARALASVRYFEGEGSGLPLAVADSVGSGAPAPTARFQEGFVVVTIRPSAYDRRIVEQGRRVAQAVISGRQMQNFGSTALPEYIEPRLSTHPSDHARSKAELGLDQIASQRRAVLVGPPGSGKTMAMRRLADLLDSEGYLPIYVSELEVERKRYLNLHELVEAAWNREGLSVSREELHGILKEVPVALFIDGLDALTESSDEDIWNDLCRASASYDNLRIFVSCGQFAASQISSRSCVWQVAEFKPWTMSDSRRFLQDAMKTQNRERNETEQVVDLVASNPGLQSLVSNPLMAELFVSTIRDVPPSRANYLTIIQSLVEAMIVPWRSRGRTEGATVPFSELLRALQWIALRLAADGQSYQRLSSSRVRTLLEDFDGSYAAPPENLLQALSRNPNVLVQVAGARDDEVEYSFSSQFVFEYLAASGAVDAWPAWSDELVELVVQVMGGRQRGISELIVIMVALRSRNLLAFLSAINMAVSRNARLEDQIGFGSLLLAVAGRVDDGSRQTILSFADEIISSLESKRSTQRVRDSARRLRSLRSEWRHRI